VTEQWTAAVADASANGILVVAASGDGPGLPFPARVPGVLAVSRLAYGAVVNKSAQSAAPGTRLIVVNAAGGLMSTQGSSYSAAYVSSIAARIAGARPGISVELLRASVSGRVTMQRAARIASVRLSPIGRVRCVRVRTANGRRTITWTAAAKAVRYRVKVGSLPHIVKGRRLVTRVAGPVTVQAVGAYGSLGPAGRSC
jgi:hypothetical protein